jgi:hypothetical protein
VLKNEEEYKEEVRLGGSVRRGCYSIVTYHFKKLKYIIELTNSFFLIELTNYFFLGRIVKLDETLAHCPQPTPSAEAPGGEVG